MDRSSRIVPPRKLILACGVVFVLAISVRVLYYQDTYVEIARHNSILVTLINPYRAEADRILGGGGILFPATPPADGDAAMILHPPGYGILAALFSKVGRNPVDYLIFFQILVDAFSAVLLFLLVLLFFRYGIALLAGMLAAICPHLSYYSLWLSPDSLVALPTILCVLTLAIMLKTQGKKWAIATGILIGVSCWFRSNALLLSPWMAVAAFFLLRRQASVRQASVRLAALIPACAVAVVLPLTIRNLIVFHRFVPTSIGNGITMIEGIADYDSAGRFGFPRYDKECATKDAEWYGRPDYANSPWSPDGVDRDQRRFSRGLKVAAGNPMWFATVMIRRAGFMISYNDSRRHEWPFSSALVPTLSPSAPFGHDPVVPDDKPPDYHVTPTALLAGGQVVAQGARVDLSPAGQLEVAGDHSEFDDQFASMPIRVFKNSDYIMTIQMNPEAGTAGVKVTSADRRIALCITGVPALDSLSARRKKRHLKKRSLVSDPRALAVLDEHSGRRAEVLRMPFSTGKNDFVRFVLSNNRINLTPAETEVGDIKLYYIGPMPRVWTALPRRIISAPQKWLFTTWKMRVLFAIGIFTTLLAGRSRPLIVLLLAPSYYLVIQSALHTEYRYTLPIHFFLLALASVGLFALGAVFAQAFNLGRRELVRKRRPVPASVPAD